ncbi:MAG: hypothetical protein M3O35_06675 [Acidobacteriota bacterium]|nr:hypothetical protein [Acidobacteriota bacterium]
MGSFTVTSGSDTLTLDTAGNVTSGSQAAGSWTTNRQNQIAITMAGVVTCIDAVWKFTDQNQLTVQPTGLSTAFNFSSDTSIRNSFSTHNGVLTVTPDKGSPFEFELRGAWNLDASHNLTFTINNVLSLINGFVSDPVGRFIYHFANKEFPLQTSVLGFVGTWDVPRDAAGAPVKSGSAMLVFNYKKEDGTAGTFQLPKSAAIEHTTNQFIYTYQKDNKTLSISFQGTLMIDPDFQITYIFNRQLSSSGAEMVGSTTIGFAAMISRPDFTADLQLTLTKNDGSAGGTTLTIGGDFTGVLGKTKLLVGFSYQQTFGGTGALTRTAGFHGDLTFANGEIQWKFEITGQTVTLAIGVDVKLGPVALDARLNLTLDHGQVAGVTFLLGISF